MRNILMLVFLQALLNLARGQEQPECEFQGYAGSVCLIPSAQGSFMFQYYGYTPCPCRFGLICISFGPGSEVELGELGECRPEYEFPEGK